MTAEGLRDELQSNVIVVAARANQRRGPDRPSDSLRPRSAAGDQPILTDDLWDPWPDEGYSRKRRRGGRASNLHPKAAFCCDGCSTQQSKAVPPTSNAGKGALARLGKYWYPVRLIQSYGAASLPATACNRVRWQVVWWRGCKFPSSLGSPPKDVEQGDLVDELWQGQAKRREIRVNELSDVVAPSLPAEEEIAPVKRRPSLNLLTLMVHVLSMGCLKCSGKPLVGRFMDIGELTVAGPRVKIATPLERRRTRWRQLKFFLIRFDLSRTSRREAFLALDSDVWAFIHHISKTLNLAQRLSERCDRQCRAFCQWIIDRPSLISIMRKKDPTPPSIPDVHWSVDMTWTLLSEVKKDENRLVLLGKQDKKEVRNIHFRISSALSQDILDKSPGCIPFQFFNSLQYTRSPCDSFYHLLLSLTLHLLLCFYY
ncbi:hypothetical protein DFJ58DRAFT_913247 [Suillus subalutaceus]|uniref:uncharacterized protein n=1 Tax=Suillus subalutaceus TaxID=48586 RepID=UPI001B87A481|nr:uncharacterized protein DFJ58DRAFT_913247 [Suillus subalutaceus]KAG1859034.1 hypothetical protein DFJ58DRAFT_913247 [Suillus subalutaceus]